MVLSPHADDAELGAGGYIGRVTAQGGEVMVVLATAGASNHIETGASALADQRIAEFQAAMRVLGVQQQHILTQGLDGELHAFPRSSFVKLLDDLQAEFEPDEILLPLPSSHQDHTYCWETGIAMTRPKSPKLLPSLVAGYEYPLSGWGPGAAFNNCKGGLYVDITASWELKLAALRQHASQLGNRAGLVSIEAVEALAHWRGLEAGYRRAELFHIVRQRWD
ncbi:PIG-L deacetylase family protein [Sphingobium sp. CFD-2]|uniref:PIG-L deacetylase family protein n=1 Tax=Sphingobium sp. CFD-2 TaxID=2878542 RepID=UPI00214BD524|nr:PIG-L deacetylase family protein [Sphingobium sp. CFD-2]